ncbi:MAG TPA: hypothetical protein VEX60_18285 [Pyrinomonadaceae bacterium]|nr:hypothetical protein [Pyrinomonadaceae bacterium]
MADCKAFREEVEESVGVEGLSIEARSHAGACPSCGEFGRERDALRRLVGGLGKVEAPADFEFRLRARMKTLKGGGGKYNFLGLRLAPGLAWAAAVSFLVVSASLYVWQQQRSPIGSQQASRDSKPLKNATGVVGDKGSAENSPAIKDVKQDAVPFDAVALVKVSDKPRRIISRRRLRDASRMESKVAAPSGGSSEFSVTGAKILRVKIPFSASPESLRFVVRDERGNTRPVPMRTVSFGSQELVAGASTQTRMAANDKGGVW